MAVMRRELRLQLREIQNRIDLAQQVIGRDTLFAIKPVEKSPIIAASIDSRKINGITLYDVAQCGVFNKIRQMQTFERSPRA